MSEGDSEDNNSDDDTSDPDPILGSQVAANSQGSNEEEGDVEVLSELDEE